MKVSHAKMNQMSRTADNATTLCHMVTHRSRGRGRLRQKKNIFFNLDVASRVGKVFKNVPLRTDKI